MFDSVDMLVTTVASLSLMSVLDSVGQLVSSTKDSAVITEVNLMQITEHFSFFMDVYLHVSETGRNSNSQLEESQSIYIILYGYLETFRA